MAHTIMVVDDEAGYRSLIQAYLEKDGYEVVTAANGREALFVARQSKPSLILLDVMMPDLDGYEFIRLHRKERNTPIILLTAKVEEADKVIGLELGADDYVTKPFSPGELMARVRAVMRRAINDGSRVGGVVHIGDLMLDLENYIFTIADERIDLTRSEFDLLAVLMQSPNRAFKRSELLERTQGMTFEGYERTIDAHIKNIRQKIRQGPEKPQYIDTVYGIGYRFIA